VTPFDFHPRTRVVFDQGVLNQLGDLAKESGFTRTLVVADRGMIDAGYVERARAALDDAGITVAFFHDFDANPDSDMVERGRAFATAEDVDSIVGLGGGSSMDCAKAINFVLTNGGSMRDYWGWNKASKPMLPSIGIPTTAGTGSEAQSYCIISDAVTHAKMACGAPGAAFRIALLDPELTRSQPEYVRQTAGYDAVSHAVESFVTTKRNPASMCFAREAWRLLNTSFGRTDDEGLASMQWGAYLAGMAIENSMLGAAHACANPLTQKYGTTHGVAIAIMLPHVVRWNAHPEYSELAMDLPARLNELANGLPRRLRDIDVQESDLAELAQHAAEQWTGRFNPRAFDAKAALELYRCAY
jgi:alcohol dehydrogenase